MYIEIILCLVYMCGVYMVFGVYRVVFLDCGTV